MTDVANFFMHLFFTLACLFIFLLAAILLKPLRFHHKRKYSTTALKISYLLYLIFFLVFSYLFFLIGGKSNLNLEESDNPKSNLLFGMLLFAFFIPNIAILLRRKIKNRTGYNITFSIINFLFTIFLFYLTRIMIWE